MFIRDFIMAGFEFVSKKKALLLLLARTEGSKKQTVP
jgi:hypothetical protein